MKNFISLTEPVVRFFTNLQRIDGIWGFILSLVKYQHQVYLIANEALYKGSENPDDRANVHIPVRRSRSSGEW